MSPDIYFDNIILTDDEEIAKKWADDSFEIRRIKIAKESVSIFLFIILIISVVLSHGDTIVVKMYTYICFQR